MNTLTVELFAPGKWNDMIFDNEDLKDMAKNFGLLKDVHFAPVKLGHNDEQMIADGLPSLGEVTEVWYNESGKDGKPKLMGKLAGLPDVVFKAISKRRYNKLSIELDIGVQHQGRFMKYVLTAVALLGADIPAVNTLADLNAYMGRKSLFTDSNTKVNFTHNFTFNNTQEDYDMDELQKAQTRIRELEANENKLKDEVRDNKSTIETFERDNKTRTENDAKTAIKTARDNVVAHFEKAVKDEIITPGQRDQFTKLLNVDDDVAVLKISTDDIDDLLKESGGKMFTKANSRSDNNNDERTESDAGEELTIKAYDIMNSNKDMMFDVAFSRAMKANPELAREHIANKEVAA